MSYPVLAPGETWYKGVFDKTKLTEVHIVNRYTGSGTERWNADVGNTGSIKCYISGTVLTIAGNGSGKIACNADSSRLFGSMPSAQNIYGLELLDTSAVVDATRFFSQCRSLAGLDLSMWDLSNVKNTERMFTACYSLEWVKLPTGDKSVKTVGLRMFYTDANLRWVEGLGNVTAIADEAFFITPAFCSADFDPKKITSIGYRAFYESSVEDSVDLSVVPLDNIGWGATRAKRWPNKLKTIQNVEFPSEPIDMYVPNPCGQKAYPDLKYATRPEGDVFIGPSGCVALSFYHVWNIFYANDPKNCYGDFKAWYEALIDYDGHFSETNNHRNNNSEKMLSYELGWTYNGLTYVADDKAGTCEEKLKYILDELKAGRPVIIGMLAHAFPIIGCNPKNHKLKVVDSGISPLKGVIYEVAFEDLFTEVLENEDDGYQDQIYVMSYRADLPASADWYRGSVSKDKITRIDFEYGYVPTGEEDESWSAGLAHKAVRNTANTGSNFTLTEKPISTIRCYRIGTRLIVSGCDVPGIFANADSSGMFEGFTSLSKLDISKLDTSNVGTMLNAFADLTSLEEVELGAQFAFKGDGALLPTPASGSWYTLSGIPYDPADIPSNVAASYFASAALAEEALNRKRYIVTGSELRRVADAIRERAGRKELMEFPSGYEETVKAIPKGSSLDDYKLSIVDGKLCVTYTA